MSKIDEGKMYKIVEKKKILDKVIDQLKKI